MCKVASTALTDMDAQFQQLSPNPFSSPKPIVLGHLPDQGDGLGGDLGLVNLSFGLALPVQAKELSMPPEQGVWLHDEERLSPCSNHSRQEHEEDAIGVRACGPFHPPFEDDQLLP
jgi:hypothetical protein